MSASTNVGIMSIAGILASAPFGIPMEQILAGTIFALVGVVGRAAFEFQKASEGGTGGIPIGKIAGWVGAGFTGAPFVTILYLVVLNIAGVKSDGIVSLGLLFLGFSGPRMVTWLLNTGISAINKKSGLNMPGIGGEISKQTQPDAPPPGTGVH